jgi:CheY-like chemotaxis protein
MCPARRPSKALDGQRISEGRTMDPRLRIVLVEDELITALDVARRLRRLGYQVVARASSGLQAIAQALAHHPDIVLMDIHLQGDMDGVDAARHIQAAAPIPVVYMSAHADAATVERSQATTRAAGFVSKPIHLPTLHATLQRVCSRPQDDLHR